ncbi:MAG: 16S rRNA (guanine(527)-N(7))-methyltransferase RsmG [Steroidobacteraceae bacterium]
MQATREAQTAKLVAGAAGLGVVLSGAQAEYLLVLLDELDDWNQRMNLTAIRDRDQQIAKHLLDSLSIHAFLRGKRIADIGTGAGFPGLPLALVNPDREFTLLDSTAKKLRFVEHAAAKMGLTNVTTAHARAEVFKPKERFDCVLARAVGPIETFVHWCGPLVIGGGRLLAMKGRFPEAEIAAIPTGWKVAAVHRLSVPTLDEERHLVEICRSHDRV